ncbi:MAG: hypothetical protein M3Y27_11030 [Acidobacteriota bacterium]|nr:hypothetical protein [Acidobacteriota bacterium]
MLDSREMLSGAGRLFGDLCSRAASNFHDGSLGAVFPAFDTPKRGAKGICEGNPADNAWHVALGHDLFYEFLQLCSDPLLDSFNLKFLNVQSEFSLCRKRLA